MRTGPWDEDEEGKVGDAIVWNPQSLVNVWKGVWVLFYWKASWKSFLGNKFMLVLR